MTSWGATKAKAQFSAMLDRAEIEGPPLVRRRRQEFYVLTKEQFEQRNTPHAEEKPFVSAWDALRLSSNERPDVEFPRVRWEPRKPDL